MPTETERRRSLALLRYTLIAQSAYYILTGVWPLLHMTSFLAVTGPKSDLWLVRTVGLLIAVVGTSILTATLLRRITTEILVLAVGVIGALFVVDLFAVLLAGVSPIYLLDALAQLVLLGCLVRGVRQGGKLEARGDPGRAQSESQGVQ